MSDREGSRLIRPYMITGGRTRSQAGPLPLQALVTVLDGSVHPSRSREHRLILDLCRSETMSVAEVAARSGSVIGVTRVLVGDLIHDGLMEISTTSDEASPDSMLLKEVLNGLRAQ
jgi:Protein of unknown function (DUF742)